MNIPTPDEPKYYFGQVCKYGHDWNNTGHSLRKRSNRNREEDQKAAQAARFEFMWAHEWIAQNS